MNRAVNDATLEQAGTIYQYVVALKDCFGLTDTDTLQIETNGDVSVLSSFGRSFQKEVKHHFSSLTLSDRSIDFWKTLANWYTEYDRIKSFSSLILSTTATIPSTSAFTNWNTLNAHEKLLRLKSIGAIKKGREATFREQYDRIFSASYDETRLLDILGKFTISADQSNLSKITQDFSNHLGYIPPENRDGYIGALLGAILLKLKEPPHRWEVTKAEFDEILQRETAAYCVKGAVPLPTDFIHEKVPPEKVSILAEKKFITSIHEIAYDQMIPKAIEDYWKTDLTVARYFRDNLMYLSSLDEYRYELNQKLEYAKADSELQAEDATSNKCIHISKQLYNNVMQWDAHPFGSIIRNQGFFQRGVIHNIVDETAFCWKVGEPEDEHCEH